MSKHDILVEYSISGGEWEKTQLWDLMESPVCEEREGLSSWTDASGVELEAFWDSAGEWDGTEIIFERSAYDHPLWTLRIRTPPIIPAFLSHLGIAVEMSKEQK